MFRYAVVSIIYVYRECMQFDNNIYIYILVQLELVVFVQRNPWAWSIVLN